MHPQTAAPLLSLTATRDELTSELTWSPESPTLSQTLHLPLGGVVQLA